MRPSTLLAIVLLGAAILGAGFVVGRSVLRESRTLANDAEGTQTTQTNTHSRTTAAPGSSGSSNREHVKQVALRVGIAGLILVVLVGSINGVIRSHRRQRWRA
jgi:hypothetical protein